MATNQELARVIRQSCERVVQYLADTMDEKAFQTFSDEFCPPVAPAVLLEEAAVKVESIGYTELAESIRKEAVTAVSAAVAEEPIEKI